MRQAVFMELKTRTKRSKKSCFLSETAKKLLRFILPVRLAFVSQVDKRLIKSVNAGCYAIAVDYTGQKLGKPLPFVVFRRVGGVNAFGVSGKQFDLRNEVGHRRGFVRQLPPYVTVIKQLRVEHSEYVVFHQAVKTLARKGRNKLEQRRCKRAYRGGVNKQIQRNLAVEGSYSFDGKYVHNGKYSP